MDRVITSDMLEHFGPTIKGIFQIMFPNGLTMQELANSKNRTLNSIYKYFKEGSNELSDNL